MSITVDQVRYWAHGSAAIGHVVMSGADGWYRLACGVYTPSVSVNEHRPSRICRKCREALKDIEMRRVHSRAPSDGEGG